MEVLSNLPCSLDADLLRAKLRMQADSDEAGDFAALVEAARARANPKAAYAAAYVEKKGTDTVTLDGVTFTSRVLRANLDKAERVFVYVATCGQELDEVPIPSGDFVKRFWLDTIKAAALGSSLKHLNEHLDRKYALGRTATMSPGSGDANVWPIEQQKALFALLGNVEEAIGVRLTDSCLMLPNKTVSALRFATEIDFRTCRLCHRKACPSRSAAFDRALAKALGHEVE